METPVGTILAFASQTLDADTQNIYMLCDGSELSKRRYRSLWDVIGYSWGGQTGGQLFNLPDLRGRFLRGRDMGAGNDPDSSQRTGNNGATGGDVVGSYQQDAFQTHRHSNGDHAHGYTDRAEGGQQYADGGGDLWAMRNAVDLARTSGGIQGGDLKVLEPAAAPGALIRVSSETRPKNANVNYIIKFRMEREFLDEIAEQIRGSKAKARGSRTKKTD